MLIQRAGKNIFYKLLGEVIPRAIAFVFFAYVARTLEAADFGKLSFAIQFSALFAILLDPGLNRLLIRDVAGQKELTNKYVSHFAGMKVVLSIVVCGLILGTIRALDYSAQIGTLVFLMALVTIMTAGLVYMGAVFTSWEKIGYEALLRVFTKLTVAVVGVGILWSGYGLVPLAAGMAAAHVPGLAIGVCLVRKAVARVRLSFEWRFWWQSLRNAFPLGLMIALSTIYVRVDVVMLGLFQVGDDQIGLYSAAMRIIDGLAFVPIVIMGGLFPIFCDLYRNEREKLPQLYQSTVRLMLLAAMPIAFGGFVMAGKLVHVIFGNGYAPAAIAFKILVWRLICAFGIYVMSFVLVATGQERKAVLCAAAGVLVNVPLNLALIPRYGYLGAAIAGVVTDVVVCSCYFYVSSRAVARLPAVKLLWRPLVGAAVMTGLLISLAEHNLLVMMAAGAAIYLITQWLLGSFSSHTWGLIKGLDEK